MSILMEDSYGSYISSFSRERLIEECRGLREENQRLARELAKLKDKLLSEDHFDAAEN